MNKSTFLDGSISYWVDYSHRSDCISVEDISEEQYRLETTPIVEEVIEPETPEEV